MKLTLPTVVSLYSFKGGAGRTLCTANLVGLLAKEVGATKNSPMVLLDMDLDSAGLTIVFDQLGVPVENKPLNMSKIIDGRYSLKGNEKLGQLMREGVIDVSEAVDAPEGSVLFIGAEAIGHEMKEPRRGVMEDHMLELLELFSVSGVSVVVMDCASGLQPIARLTRRFSNLIVYCCRLTGQFLWGTTRELKLFVGTNLNDEKLNIIILPVAVPESGRTPFSEECFKTAMAELKRLELDLKGHANAFLLEPGVCEVESFKWAERILSRFQQNGNLAPDEKAALGTFRQLAQKITEMTKLSQHPARRRSSTPIR